MTSSDKGRSPGCHLSAIKDFPAAGLPDQADITRCRDYLLANAVPYHSSFNQRSSSPCEFAMIVGALGAVFRFDPLAVVARKRALVTCFGMKARDERRPDGGQVVNRPA
jgi:hypothetical protein